MRSQRGQLVDRLFLLIEHMYEGTIVGSELRQGIVEAAETLLVGLRLVGLVVDGVGQALDGRVVVHRGRPVGALFAQGGEGRVVGDAVDPGSEAAIASEGAERTEGLQAGVLSQLFGVGAVARHAHQEGKDGSAVTLHERSEAGRIAVQNAVDVCFIVDHP